MADPLDPLREDAALIAKLQAQVGELQSQIATQSALRMKVSEKGALSLYGVNTRFPVTLYWVQWLRVLDYADQIRAFIEANKKSLATKAPKKATS